jgi:hypothetical protein
MHWIPVLLVLRLYMFQAAFLPETCRVVIPIKLKFSASVGFIHTEHRLVLGVCFFPKSPLHRRRQRSFFVHPLYSRPDFNSLPLHPDLLVASVIFCLFLILWCFEGLRFLSLFSLECWVHCSLYWVRDSNIHTRTLLSHISKSFPGWLRTSPYNECPIIMCVDFLAVMRQ